MIHRFAACWLIAAMLLACTALDGGVGQTGQTGEVPDDHSLPKLALAPRKGMVPPVPIYYPQAPYSPEARNLKIERTVKLMILVGTDGRVGDVHVTSKRKHDGLDENALTTVRSWRFRPAMLDGKAVKVHLQVEVTYHLSDRPSEAPR